MKSNYFFQGDNLLHYYRLKLYNIQLEKEKGLICDIIDTASIAVSCI